MKTFFQFLSTVILIAMATLLWFAGDKMVEDGKTLIKVAERLR